VGNILMPENPAYQRYERLVDALGTGPTHSAYEQAALARIVGWSSPGGLRRAHPTGAQGTPRRVRGWQDRRPRRGRGRRVLVSCAAARHTWPD
jgi:hypothetical protein